MHAWSDQGERILDKVERSTLAVDCTEADFSTLETALYQVLHRATTNEPLRMVQQVHSQRGCEAWHMIVRRYDDERNMSDRSSAHAALISNISERGRAKDVDQLDDILRNFINETNKYEGRWSSPWHHIAIRGIAHRSGEHHYRQGHDTFGIQGEEN